MTLANKLHITDRALLARQEEKYSKRGAVLLFTQGLLTRLTPGTFSSLACIHKTLFEDIYSFAGQLRSENLSKSGFLFAFAAFLPTTVRTVEQLPQNTLSEIIYKYSEMNAAHPFLEGNGRSTRLWLDCVLRAVQHVVVDWRCISKKDYMEAMYQSNTNNLAPLQELLSSALTDKTEDLTVYLENIDASFAYEGFHTFQAADLLK